MTPTPVPRWKLAVLLFVQAAALGMHTAPLTNIMEAQGLPWAPAFIFTASAAASLFAPLVIGALADLRFAPERLLTVLLASTAASAALLYAAVDHHWPHALFLLAVGAFALSVTPAWGLLTAICMAALPQPKLQYPPLRVMATFGWMAALVTLSYVLAADSSPRAGYAAAGLFALEAVFCATLPPAFRPKSTLPRPWGDLLGFRALSLLRHPDHRVLFLTTALFSIPLAAFYPYTGPHLRDLGSQHPAAILALAQVTEIFAMVYLPNLLDRFRMKWILFAGLLLGTLRYLAYATDFRPAVIAGLCLHGLIYSFFFVTGQLYLEERVDHAMRAQAQAMLAIMATGVGSLIGYVAGGWWYAACHTPDGMNWPRFWLAQAGATGAVSLFFLLRYHGKTTS